MKKTFQLFLILLCSKNVEAQYDYLFHTIISPQNIFKNVEGEFKPVRFEWVKIDGENRRINYGYRFNNSFIPLDFFFPITACDSACSYFILHGQKINLKGKFESDFACDLDVNSFKVYQGKFNNSSYILLTCINRGSGSFTTTILCNLFDVTNKDSIEYYPLWSKYGSKNCFGDFNHDGVMDFLRIRNINIDTLKIDLLSKQNNTFQDYNNKKYLKIYSDGEIVKTLENKWY